MVSSADYCWCCHPTSQKRTPMCSHSSTSFSWMSMSRISTAINVDLLLRNLNSTSGSSGSILCCIFASDASWAAEKPCITEQYLCRTDSDLHLLCPFKHWSMSYVRYVSHLKALDYFLFFDIHYRAHLILMLCVSFLAVLTGKNFF